MILKEVLIFRNYPEGLMDYAIDREIELEPKK